MPGTPAGNTDTIETQINNAVRETTRGDDGKLTLPEGLDGAMKAAVISEVRRRDTQASYTKTQQSLRQKEAELGAIKGMVNPSLNISQEKQDELETLKFRDPDAWRAEMDSLEAASAKTNQETLEATLKQASDKALSDLEVQTRANLLTQYNGEHPDAPITEENLLLDVPQRLNKKLADGSISFAEFLDSASSYLGTEKVVNTVTKRDEVNMGEQAGGAAPNAPKGDEAADYEKAIF